MSFLHLINPLYTASGFAVGMLVGFTGVGGGALMTPLLVLLFGIHPATAVGTDLLYAGVTKISGSAVHGLNGAIDWRVARRLASGSIPAAALSLLTLSHLGVDSKGTSAVITTTLGFALILTAVTLIFRRRLLATVTSFLDNRSDNEIALLTVTLGAALGVLVSISSVGAGAIGVTALLMLYPKNADGADRRHRHRARRAAHPSCGRRPLVAGLGRLAIADLAAVRLDTGHRDRKPRRLPRAGTRIAALDGGNAGPRRLEARFLTYCVL